MKNTRLAITAVLCVGCLGAGRAETSAYWAFDDQAPGITATVLVSEVNADVLVGQAKNTGGAARNPAHHADVPGTNIFDGLYGALLNADNRTSLYFTNAAAFPAQTNSQNGGYVEVTNVTSLLCPTNFTIEFFTKIARDVDWPLLVGKAREYNTTGIGASWGIDLDRSNPLKLRMDTQPLYQSTSGNGFNQNLTGPNIQDGQWHHVAVTYHSPTRKATLYVDYVTQWNMTSTHEVVYDTKSLFFGKGAGSNQAFDGWLDEVRLSDTVLQPHEFLRTYSIPKDAQLYYTFDDAAASGTATTLVCEAYTPILDGNTGGSTIRPTFSPEVAPANTPRISHGYKGEVVNADNRSSLFFVNAGLPGNTNSNAGGKVAIPGYLHPSNFTVEAFIRMNRHVNYPLIVGKVRYGDYPTWSLSLACTNSLLGLGDVVRVRMDTFPDGAAGDYGQGFNQTFSSGVSADDGAWHHVAFSYETALKRVKLYVDYTLRTTGMTINPIVYTDGDILVGSGAGERAFDGWIDEVRITPRLLEPDEFLYTVPMAGTLISIQ
jgi:hypothetical protein